tara:strand:- start:6166 stop:8106 length:1941 start_codon:yes stop_codon:yes gene_type:complete
MASILEVIINGDAKGLNKSLSSASSKLKAFGRQTTDIGTRLSTRLTLPIGLAGAAMIKLASDTDESLNKVDVAFKGSSQEVRDFAKTTLQSFGIARGQALDMAALFGDMSTSMGLSTAEAAKMSISLTGLAGDLASFKNINIEEVTTALAGVFTGETESLKRLGIVMTEVNLQQFAIDKGMTKSIKKMTQAEKVALRYEFIMSKTANSQGDFARTSGGAANQMRMFSQGLKELGSVFGEIILPFFTKLVIKGNELIKKLKELSPKIKESILKFAGLAAILPPLLIVIGSIATAIGSISAPIAIAIIAISSLIVYFDDIVEAGERLRVFLQNKLNVFLIKAKEKFELLGGQVNRLGSIFREVLSKGFSADIDSINKKFDEQSKAIKEATKNELKLLNTKKENKKETEKETKAIAENNKEQEKSNNTIQQTRKEVESVKEFSGKRLVSLFDPSKKAAFGFNFEKIKTDFSGLKKQSKSLKDQFTIDFNQIGSTIAETFGQALVSGGNVFADLSKTILSIIGDLIIQMGAAAVAASNLAKTFAIPIVGAAAGLAAIALGTIIKGLAGKMQSGGVTAFANGGIVSSPTLGLMGEYPGARSNPEVIAPLDKLKSMIGGGQTNVNITGGFKLEGQDLVLALQRADRNRTRIL